MQLPIVVINRRAYYEDARLREFRAIDDPGERLSFFTVEDNPDTYTFGMTIDEDAPVEVAYIRLPDNTCTLCFVPATDGRPHFHQLPFLVRAAAKLAYLIRYFDFDKKRAAAQTPFAKAAVYNDILYKLALDCALDPDNPNHKPFIVDVSGDHDDFSKRGVVPFSQAAAADIVPGDIKLGRAVLHIRRPDETISTWVIDRTDSTRRFSNYPLAIRIEARARFFWHATPEESRILAGGLDLPASQQQLVWDELLCRRADALMRRNRRHDRAHDLPPLDPSPPRRRRQR